MVDEVAVPDGEQEIIPAAVEVIIHNAGMEVKKIPVGPGPGDTMTLLRFHTPAQVYTIKLDDAGVNVLVNHLRGTVGSPEIVIAAPGDIPQFRVGR